MPPGNSQKRVELIQRMTEFGVDEADIEETFTHYGQGATAPICVMLLHRPSGLSVKCQATRNQEQNRLLARQLLVDKIERSQTSYGKGPRFKYTNLVLAFILIAVALILLTLFGKFFSEYE
jgi:hypothetical protein